jgi:cell wall-associated NlpC family hydrolase
VKNFLTFILIVVAFTSCVSKKPLVYPGSGSVPPPQRVERDPQFLESVSVNAANKPETTINKPATAAKTAPGASAEIENSHPLQFKYAIILGEAVETIDNARLISFMEDWYGTPYQFGGDNKKGIDCSAFTCVLMDTVYGITLPRTAKSQYNSNTKIKREDLKEGDLVFFNTNGGISHVGVYLANNKFIHAAASGGVMISDLNEEYFRRRYIGAARAR